MTKSIFLNPAAKFADIWPKNYEDSEKFPLCCTGGPQSCGNYAMRKVALPSRIRNIFFAKLSMVFLFEVMPVPW